jgi:hypothetical protein
VIRDCEVICSFPYSIILDASEQNISLYNIIGLYTYNIYIVLAYMGLIHCISTVFLNSEKDSDIKVCDGGAL